MALVAIITAATASINIYMIKSTEKKIISSHKAIKTNPDCIIILGAMVYSDGTPAPVLKERLDKGIELYKAGVSNKLLMSGDNGTNQYNEVIPMRQYAINNGVAEEDIYLDYAGFSTYESMYRLRDIFQVDSAIVVTQTYHLYRSLYIGDRLGIDIKGVSAKDIPSGQKQRDIREILARVKSFGLVFINADPTYLGDPVPLSEPQKVQE